MIEIIPEGKMLTDDGELVDAYECCDGSDDANYSCSFPPCVAAREAEARQYAPRSVANGDLAYELDDPKHPTYFERAAEFADA